MSKTIHVLVAAPDGSDVEPAVAALREAGLEVAWRRVGSRDALHTELDRGEGADAVLLDPALPGVDGIDGIERVTEPHPEVPVVVVTDALSDEEAVACMRAGAWDRVTRDRLAGLACAVERALEMAPLRVERERTRQRLRLLERALESSPVMVMLTNRQGRIEYVNPAFSRTTGFAEDEILGATPRKLRSGMHPPELYEELWSTILSGNEWRGQLTNRRKDGTLYDVDLTIAPVRGAGGEVTHFAAAGLDVSDRVRAQEALERSERQLREVQRVARLGSYELRLADATWTSSAGMDEILGIDGEPYDKDLRGFLSLVHPDDRELLRHAVEEEVFGGQGRRDHEYRIVRKSDREVRWVYDRGALSRDDHGRPVSMIGTIQDVTRRKTLEIQLRQAQKMEAVGQLTGGIAHDFNNVLTAISTNAEIVRGLLPDDSELEDDLTEILEAARRGASMVGRLLQFSRQGRLSMENVSVGQVASDLRSMIRSLLPATIHLEIRDDTGAADRVYADVTAVEQILVNLCTNARDAMPEGGTVRIECERVRIESGYVATHPWVEPGDYVALAVTDSGTGMDRAEQEKAFEPFFTTKPPGKGTGLGLAMVYGLVKQHHGMVHIYSELGSGTTVKTYFPAAERARPDEAPSAPARRTVDLARTESGGETVLVADDEQAIQRATRRALESAGYRVLLAGDGEEALEVFRERRDEVNLVISDLVMPNLGGRQLMDALRGEGESVPILLTSGYSPESANDAFEHSEGVAFLQKPWSLSELLERVRELVEAPRSERPR